MIVSLVGLSILGMICFALHVTNTGSFPKPLNEQEEAEALRRLAQGDDKARTLLIEHNLRLVAHIVKKYYSSGCDQDDLISIGTNGLIKGISTFNPDKNIKLATYASRCIENEILMSFRTQKKSAQDVYINDPIDMDKEGNALTLLDIISQDDTILEDIDCKMKIECLQKYIEESLSSREQYILKQRYGLGGGEERTQNQIAKELKISRSYVSRIEKKALDKLRKRFDG